jgi:hypothetical protein
MFRRDGRDRFGLAVTLATVGIAEMTVEHYGAARRALEESAALSRDIGDNWALSLPLRNLGIVAFRQGDVAEAVKFLRETLLILRDLNERWFISRSLETMAEIFAHRGDYGRPRDCSARARCCERPSAHRSSRSTARTTTAASRPSGTASASRRFVSSGQKAGR